MPVREIDGYACLGVLSLPMLNRKMPIIDTCSEENLKVSPCRYHGTIKGGDLVIAGHSYAKHFADFRTLKVGEVLYFTDVEDVQYELEIAEIEVLAPTDIDGMIAGDYPFTLFTCTYGGTNRLAVRCNLIDTYVIKAQ